MPDQPTGLTILISLLEAVIDRAADHLERVGQIVDDTSKKVFHPGQRKRARNFQELLEKIGEEGDFTSKMRESLVSIGRLCAFVTATMDQTKQNKESATAAGDSKRSSVTSSRSPTMRAFSRTRSVSCSMPCSA
jgi:magnesium transporter